ncbi:thioredoxin-dependent thiol peroxidase [bacterium]|nr:thioredoxin-dependent thiol peroxidase [bacterium]
MPGTASALSNNGPQAGDKAPAFNALPASGGQTLSLKDYAGKKLVLYFYPKDDTPGCTTEGIDFSHAKHEFEKLGAVILGASKDSPKSHDKFCQKHSLTIDLVSDESGSLCEAYGVWVEKSMYGKKYMGIERATFLIDEQGIVRQVWRSVKVPGHVQDVLAAVRGL